jgi:hypothetical protein
MLLAIMHGAIQRTLVGSSSKRRRFGSLPLHPGAAHGNDR